MVIKINFRAFWVVLRALLLILLIVASSRARAVETIVSGSAGYNTAEPTSSQIPNWGTGWGMSGISGWNYVGTVGGASGVYLGNNWAITAGHVGAGPLTLDGTLYGMVAGSAVAITNSNGTADMTLFRLSTAPNLPSLVIPSSTPNAFSVSQSGDSVAMIGYGGGSGETWGLNVVTQVNGGVALGASYFSTDFETAFGQVTYGNQSITNNATLVGGDSGGGDFIFDSSTGQWTLAGINEMVDDNNSYMVQLSTYEPQIQEITGVPEPNCRLLAGLGLTVLLGLGRRTTRRAD